MRDNLPQKLATSQPVGIGRMWKDVSVTIGTSEATSEAIEKRGFAGGSLRVSAGITLLTLYAGFSATGVFSPLYDEDDAPVTMAVGANVVQAMPNVVYKAAFLKFVGNTAGTAELHLEG